MAWIDTIINGVFLGGLYGVLGLGLALAFGVMRVINVSHGEFIVLAAYFAVMMSTLMPWVQPLFFILPVVLATFAVGYVYQAVLINRVVETKNLLVPMLLTFGISIVLRNSMLEIFGANPTAINAGRLAVASFEIAELHIGVLPFITFAVAVILFSLLHYFIRYTRFGQMVRATADNPQIIRLMGVDPKHIYAVTMGLSLALAGVAGLLLGMRTSFTAISGTDNILIAFEVVVLGGMGSFWGALIAGIMLGVTQLVSFRFDSNSGLLYSHLMFFLFLIVRPNGLFGAKS